MKVQFKGDSLHGIINLPASKSISNRALMIRFLNGGEFPVENLSKANDTIILNDCLEKIKTTEGLLTLDIKDAGTPFRFLTSLLCIQENKEFVLTGNERMKQRPVGALVDALQSIGATITYLENPGFAPLLIQGAKLKGGNIQIDGSISSQFISSLCLIAPLLENGLSINITHDIVSESYVDMTLAMMRVQGIKVERKPNHLHIPQQEYTLKSEPVENDWSSATFFYSMAMLMDEADIQLCGLSQPSLQGDSVITQIAADFGIESRNLADGCLLQKKASWNISFQKEYDLSGFPDLAVPFIVACAVRYPGITIKGVHHLELKESKRISALQEGLKKIGIDIDYHSGVLRFNPWENRTESREVSLNCYDDHRLVMAFSMLALMGLTVNLENSDCVSKSYPGFFDQIRKLGFDCSPA